MAGKVGVLVTISRDWHRIIVSGHRDRIRETDAVTCTGVPDPDIDRFPDRAVRGFD